MPTLYIINGPCGVGKSTTAQALNEHIPFSYLVDVRQLMENLSRQYEDDEIRWSLRDTLVPAAISASLSTGRDTIVDKMSTDHKTLDAYYSLAEQHSATIKEILLFASLEEVLRRSQERGYEEGHWWTPERCKHYWHQVDQIKNGRPQAQIVQVQDKTTQQLITEIVAS